MPSFGSLVGLCALSCASLALGCTRGSVQIGGDPPTEPVETGLTDTGAATPTCVGCSAAVEPLTCSTTSPTSGGSTASRFETMPLEVDPPARRYLAGAAASVGDVDGDGWLDVVVLTVDGPMLFRHPGPGEGGSTARDASRWTSELLPGADQAAASVLVDADADGDLDLYVGRYDRPDMWFANDAGTFVDRTSEVLGAVPSANTLAVSFADIDRDGDLDGLALTAGTVDEDPDVPVSGFAPSEPALLWINQGDGTFIEAGDTLPEAVHTGFSMAGGLHDLDRDGAIDLYVVNDFGGAHGSNRWLRGDGTGSFTEAGAAFGLDITTTGMGLGIGDTNGDGIDDLTIPYWGGLRILESSAADPSDPSEPVWFDATVVRVPEPFGVAAIGWGAEHVDLDHDGDLDVYASFGHLEFEERWGNPESQSDRVWRNRFPEPGAWDDVTTEWGLDEGAITRGTVFADLDADGWLDLVRPSQDAPAILWSRCVPEAGALRVSVSQPGSNPAAIGARVRVESGLAPQERVIRAGGTNYGSSGPAEAHFGLATEAVATVIVTWPDGTLSRVEHVPVPARLVVERAP